MTALLKRNVHPLERAVRAIVGVGLLSIAFVGPATPLGYLGLIPLATAALGTCPLYTVFGFSTCPLTTK